MSNEKAYKRHLSQKGEKFGRLTLTGKIFFQFAYGQNRRTVEAECECGSIGWYLFTKLTQGEVKSCGCLRVDVARETMTTHGLTQHPLYDVYHAMLKRCYIESCKAYPDYGGRGIEVCEEWQANFMTYFNWCIENGWKEGDSIDRKNNDGHYNPGNCRIVTGRKVQNRNTRRNKNITAFGETKCLFDWAADPRCAITKWALRSRLDRGKWTDMEAMITTPQTERAKVSRSMKSNVMLTAFGETKCITDWVKDERCVVGLDGLRDRITRDWDAEKALTTTRDANRKRLYLTAFGETKGIIEWSKDERCVVGLDALRDRIKKGMEPELALTIGY